MANLIRKLKKDEIRKRSDFSIGKALVVAAIGYVLWMPINLWINSSEKDKQKEIVKSILEKECLKNCSEYGVTLNDLEGPDFEYYKRTGRDAGEYMYSWHSHNNDLLVKVTVSWTPESRVKTSVDWIKK